MTRETILVAKYDDHHFDHVPGKLQSGDIDTYILLIKAAD